MVDTATTNYGLIKPEIHASPDTWGAKLNSNSDSIDNILFTIQNQAPNDATKAYIAAAATNVPVGGIIMFDGPLSSVPTNWHVCDGTGGTPDLRDKFIVGAGATYSLGATGGSASFTPTLTVAPHTLTAAEMPYHDHAFSQSPHGHSITDNGHVHGIYDPGHAHTIPGPIYGPSGKNAASFTSSGVGPSWNAPQTDSNGANGCGLSIANNGTGIGIIAINANINFTGQGGGGGHSHTASSNPIPLYSPFYAAYYIKRLS